MRLFIAIQFERTMLGVLTKFQEAMKAQGVTGNYTRRENLHLTLAFIGDYGNPDEVLDAMEQVSFVPFSIQLEGVGNYGDLFWAGIEKNEELALLAGRLRKVLSERKIPFDKKKFSPHITLIRRASYRNGQKIPVQDVPAGEMKVNRISLMKSERGRQGMVYTEMGCVEFSEKLCEGRQN